ncbi:nitroreductase [Amycolatopsis mongoliensis]|uniref:Nitroreductase n=1 Tax=Amycolatopsis mongoliensis TaxID=715475 RepID=A0A9Y2JJK4_9PSEU|nr:nitroreductase [Amycolatopsis sp. 4-36]WIX98466.1 nitroreductase [Amycolatopsis sp. 4-36]
MATVTSLVERLIRDRRATRAFLPDPVPDETIEAVFRLAGAAPSNSNAQPWQVEVVSGAARDNFAEALVAAGRAGRQTVDFPYSDGIYSPVHQRRRAEFGAVLYDAPHVALLYAPESGDARLTADVGMYAQTLLLAMAAYGVASCPQTLLSFYADTVRETLGVTGGKLLFGIAFGYADPTAAINSVAVGREPLEKTTRFHR